MAQDEPYRPMYTKELFPLRGHALTEGSREQRSNDCLSVNPNLVAHMSGLHRDCDTIPEMDPPLPHCQRHRHVKPPARPKVAFLADPDLVPSKARNAPRS
jgi:hypothetical protein